MEKILPQMGILIVFILLIFLSVKLIAYLRRKRTNTELWGTAFEGITHYIAPQEPLKEPEVFIEKKRKEMGRTRIL